MSWLHDLSVWLDNLPQALGYGDLPDTPVRVMVGFQELYNIGVIQPLPLLVASAASTVDQALSVLGTRSVFTESVTKCRTTLLVPIEILGCLLLLAALEPERVRPGVRVGYV